MKREDAITICAMISDVITSRRGEELFPHGRDGAPSSLGAIWIAQVEKVPDEDTEMATMAVIELTTGMATIPTPTDFHSMLRKLKREKKPAAVLDESEPEFKRSVSDWVKGKMLALAHGDVRAWPDQKAGYDAIQRSYPDYRTYVWKEQEQMPDDEQDRYIEQAAKMTSNDFDLIYESVTGGKQ